LAIFLHQAVLQRLVSVEQNKPFMSSCQALLKLYPGPVLPTLTDSTEVKQAWLLRSEWGCLNAQKDFVPKASCPTDVTMTGGQFKTLYPILRETGFLAFVNERGGKAIFAVTGVLQPVDLNPSSPTFGEALPGDKTLPSRPAYCASLCNNFTVDSLDCFTCVAERWASNKSLYPELPSEPVDAETIRQAVQCSSCMARKVAHLSDASARMDAAWDCLNGSESSGLATNQIIMIVILGFVFVANAIGLIVWLVLRKREPAVPAPNTNY
jgi:hypothetical protein